jgi:hexulose-6-phosphate isomerase
VKEITMLKGINYWAFSGAEPVAAMKTARALGFDCFEFTVEPSGPVSLETTQAGAEKLREEAARIGLQLKTVAAGLSWGTPPTHPDPAVREQAVKNTLKIVEVAAWLGAETILHVPGMVSAVFIPEFAPQPYDQVYQWARESLLQVLPAAEKLRVKIGIENVWNRFLLSPLEMRDFIDSFGSNYVGAYFDVGNVLLYGHPEHWISILGRRIFAVHLKDFRVNVGNLDGFVDLLSGDVKYPAVMAALRQIGYQGAHTAEIVPGQPGCVEKAIAAMKIIEQM